MGGGRKTVTIAVPEKSEHGRNSSNVSARNLSKADLGGIIFGCQHNTMKECLDKNLFGLPASHMAYVKNAVSGMPLFLFNYSDRKLHGVFEATSSGQLCIDPHAWTYTTTAPTRFPAQVRVRLRNRCRPLLEQYFSPIIADNYHEGHYFWNELDHTQTAKLLSLFELSPLLLQPQISQPAKDPQGESSYASAQKSSYVSAKNNTQPAKNPQGECSQGSWSTLFKTSTPSEDQVSGLYDFQLPNEAKDGNNVKDMESLINELLEENKRLKVQVENQDLRKQYEESSHIEEAYHTDDNVLIIGGHDGTRILSDFSQYSLSYDRVRPLKPMTVVRSNTSAAMLNSELYVFGGANANSWYDTVESYNFTRNMWVARPPLNHKRGSLGGISLSNRLYAIGGGDGIDCFAEVEMFDVAYGRWTFTKAMQHKRFTPAVASMNGVIYAIGGFDGYRYLRSVERFDPREPRWTQLNDMMSARGCHSVVAYNEKLYALGGYDGGKFVSSVEIFDPRTCTWVVGEPMRYPRVYSAAVVTGGKIYVIGGLSDGTASSDSIERCTEGYGWRTTNLKALGKRSAFSAVVF